MQLFPEERQQEQTAGGGNSRQTRKEEKKRKRGRCRVGAWGFHDSGGRGLSSHPTLVTTMDSCVISQPCA